MSHGLSEQEGGGGGVEISCKSFLMYRVSVSGLAGKFKRFRALNMFGQS